MVAQSRYRDTPKIIRSDASQRRQSYPHRVFLGISFWYALIVAAAESAGAEVLYTEDLNDRQQYGAVPCRIRFALQRLIRDNE